MSRHEDYMKIMTEFSHIINSFSVVECIVISGYVLGVKPIRAYLCL